VTYTAGASGSVNLTLVVTNASGCSATSSLSVPIDPLPTLLPAAATAFVGTFDTAFTQTFTASGGTGPFTFAISPATPPAGLTFAGGVLSGTPNVTGTFSFTVTATSAVGCASTTQSYSLTVRPNLTNDAYSGVGNTQLFVTGVAGPPATPAVASGTTAISNDTPSGGVTVTGVASPCVGLGGTITIDAAGRFIYTPPVGLTGNDVCTYTAASDTGGTGTPATATATITIGLAKRVWYVNGAAGAGDGRSHSPFNSLAPASTAHASSDTVFVQSGGTPTSTPGAITMKATTWLWGQGTALPLVGGIAIQNTGATTKPVVTETVTFGGSDVTISSLDISTSGAVGLTDDQAGAITGVTVQNNATVSAANAAAVVLSDVTTSGSGILLSSVTSSNSGATGVALTNVGGTFTASGGAITSATGTDFLISGGTADVTWAGTITDDVGTLVSVSGSTGGTKTFSGAITDGDDGDGSGITLTGNTGATITFSGGLLLSTGGNPAFTATGGGTVNVCDENPCGVSGSNGPLVNTLTTTTATALNVASTTIGASNLEFRSISVNGAAKGISLNATGTSGGLKVKGTGAAGSGGTIQSCTQRGAELIATSNVSLVRMSFTGNGTATGAPCGSAALATSSNTGCNGPVYLQNVTTATLDSLVVNGSAQQGIVALDSSGLALSNSTLTSLGNGPDEDGLHVTNLSGTNLISNTSITGSGDDNVNIQNLSGTSTINISGGSFSTGVLGSGLLFGIRGSSNTTITVAGTTVNDNFSGGIVADAYDTATLSIDVGTSTITNNNDGIQVSAGQTASAQYDIHDNPNISGQDFVAITLLKAAFSTGGALEGAIRNNVITVANGRPADAVFVSQLGGGALRTAIQSNTINYAGTQRAILLQAGQDGNGSLESTITGNTIDIQLDGAGNAVAGILAQSAITGPGNTASLCTDIGGAGGLRNTFTHSLGGTMAAGDIRVRQRNDGTVRLPGYGGAFNDTAAVITYLSGRNTVVSAPTATLDSSGFTGGGACVQPIIP